MNLRELTSAVARGFSPASLNALRRVPRALLRNTQLERFLRDDGGDYAPGGASMLARYRGVSNYQHAWVFACLNRVCQTGSAVRYALFEPAAGKGKKQEVANNPLMVPKVGLFANPNPLLYSGFQPFLHDLMLKTVMGGNGMVFEDPQRLSTGQPTRITALSWRQAQPQVDADGNIARWQVQLGSRPARPVPSELITHVKYPPDPDAAGAAVHKGVGPVQAAQMDLDVDFASLVWNASVLSNSGNVDVALSYKPTRPQDKAWLNPDQVDEIYAGWLDEHGGPMRAGGIHVLGGPFDLTRLGATTKDMDFFNGRRFSREAFAAAIGVPLPLVFADAAGLQSQPIKESWRMLYQSAVIPLLMLVQQALQNNFVDRYAPGLVGEFCLDEIPALRDDENDKSVIVERYAKMGVPLNDLIDVHGLPYKKTQWGDTGLVPYTFATIEDVIAHGGVPARLTEAGPPGSEPPVNPDDNKNGAPPVVPGADEPGAGKGKQSPAPPPAKQKAIAGFGDGFVDVRTLLARRDAPVASAPTREPQRRTAQIVAITRAERWRKFVRTWEPLEERFIDKLGRHYMPIRAEVLANLKREEERGAHEAWRRELARLNAAAYRAHELRQVRLADSLRRQIARAAKDKALTVMFDRGKAAIDLRKLTKPLYLQAIETGAEGGAKELDVQAALSLESEAAASLLELKLSQVTRIDDYTEQLLFDTLTEGYTNGETVQQLAVRVRAAFNNLLRRDQGGDDAGPVRARLIARTEVGGAVNGGRMLEYKEQGVGKIEWLSARDEHVRETHKPEPDGVDGEVVAIGEQFSNGLEYPGDPNGDPSEVCNCFLPGTLVSGALVAVLQARYAGPAREIVTEQGYRLRVTPNHPVLTATGFRPAATLRVGDQLVAYRSDVNLSTANDDDGEIAVEQVAEALLGEKSVVQAGARDFHGDGRFVEQQVDVVRTYHRLLRDGEIFAPDVSGKFRLVPTDAAGGGAVGGGNLATPRALPHVPPLQPLCVGAVAWLDPSLPQPSDDRGACEAERGGDGLDAVAAREAREHVVDGNVASLPAGGNMAGGDQLAMQSRSAEADFVRELLQAGAGAIAFDQVVDVRDFDFTGHVYDLQSASGYVTASRIICKQCRCTTLPVIDDAADENA